MQTTSLQPLLIDYESEGFPASSPVANGSNILQTNWNELLWAAVTVGRPNRQYVFRHGASSMYEAIFRWSLVRMTLEQRGPNANRLRRTNAAKTLDPSEKGAVSYFLGMAFARLFAAKLLQVPWLLHLDVYRPMLNPILKGRSRPDLVGQTANGEWVAIESKGRISPPDSTAKAKAKQQAERVISVNGTPPQFHIGGITYFRNDIPRFFWRDPKPQRGKTGRSIKLAHDDHLLHYSYQPVIELIRSQPQSFQNMLLEPILLPIRELDIEVGIHPYVLKPLIHDQWTGVIQGCLQYGQRLHHEGYQIDGIRVKAGKSWLTPFVEQDFSQEKDVNKE
ncbi:MAG: hypothetical protein QG577_909 [Thermodesulfobacteriota bacterium]|nr:hypothetical protein [Thermodesulfobacteriota bacterium]